jgi:hypothetical protein
MKVKMNIPSHVRIEGREYSVLSWRRSADAAARCAARLEASFLAWGGIYLIVRPGGPQAASSEKPGDHPAMREAMS